ncbi:MAG: VWA-like domain-containing protein, partial [Thermotogota bacterium]
VRASVKNLKEKPLPGLCLPPGIGAGQMNWMVEWAYPKAKISWKHLLKDHLEHSGASGARVRTYLRSHPREGGGILLKGKTPLKMEQILILLDTSSSMRKEDYNQFIGVIKSLRSERRSFSIMQWDTARQSEPVPVERFMRLEKPRLRGGGGTNMRAGVLEASKRYPQFKRIIVVTDGHTPYFTKMNPSPVPVIWALTSNARFANADGAVIRLYSK